jgi:hypothetical protein
MRWQSRVRPNAIGGPSLTRLNTLLAAAGLATLGFAALPGTAHAQAFISGTQLAKACASRTPADENACNGYIAGSLDEVAANSDLRTTICPPAGTKLSVLRLALAKYGAGNQADTKGSGIALVHAMIKATYPCPAPK